MEKISKSESQDFRQHLQQELLRRCRANPRYSLRAFARALGVQAPTLSHILRGRRVLTPAMIVKLSRGLSLDPAQLRGFVLAANQGLPIEPEQGGASELNQLTMDAFAVLSDWYPFAILELVNLKHFKPSPRWIARALGVSVTEVNIAVERLERLELLSTSGPRWTTASQGNTTIGGELTTAALRKVQRQFLEKAIAALEEVPAEARDQSGMTLAIELKDMPELRTRIKKFRRELMEFAERNRSGDEVYQLSVSLFPLSKTKEKSQ